MNIGSFTALTSAGAPLRGGGTVRPPSTPLPGYSAERAPVQTLMLRASTYDVALAGQRRAKRARRTFHSVACPEIFNSIEAQGQTYEKGGFRPKSKPLVLCY